MPGAVDFNEAFFQTIGTSAAVEGLCVAAAQDIAADWRATAPRDSGEYADGIVVRVKRQKRVVALVVGTDPKTLLLESKGGYAVRALQRRKRGRG